MEVLPFAIERNIYISVEYVVRVPRFLYNEGVGTKIMTLHFGGRTKNKVVGWIISHKCPLALSREHMSKKMYRQLPSLLSHLLNSAAIE